MLSPLETGTTRGRPRERSRNRATRPWHGYPAPAGGARRQQGRLVGLARRGRGRPLHLIHGGALSDSGGGNVPAGHPRALPHDWMPSRREAVPARPDRPTGGLAGPGAATAFCAQTCGCLVQNRAGSVRARWKCWGFRFLTAPVTGRLPGRAQSTPCACRGKWNCPHTTPQFAKNRPNIDRILIRL